VEPKLKLFTDSAADLPHPIRERYDVGVVPLSVVFGNREYKDGATITAEEFYRLLASEPDLPSPNQVNPHEFVEVFAPYVSAGYHILYIGLSHRLSGTLQSAVIAKELLKTDRIHVFDSYSASLGEALYVLHAAEMAESGLAAPEIVAELERHRQDAFGFFMLDALDHIVRGGRLSKAQGFVGSLLQIKPILHFTPEGTIEVREKARTTKKALQALIDRALAEPVDFANATVAVAHTNAGAVFDEFVAMVKEQLRPKRVITGLVGPTVAAHAGPGGIGIFY